MTLPIIQTEIVDKGGWILIRINKLWGDWNEEILTIGKHFNSEKQAKEFMKTNCFKKLFEAATLFN